jgi:Tfp pilus assembly protein PilN
VNVTKLNLASQPFRNRALPWIITAIITGASLLALFLIISESRAANARADTVASSMETLRKQEAELIQKKDDINKALAPEQKQLLDAAHILVDRKQFSWSRLFADLEAVLPANVRVIRINVRDLFLRGNQTSASLELTVMSKSPTDVTNMMTEMNRGGVFYAQATSQNLPKGRDQSGMEWVLSVIYKPPAGAPAGAEQRPATVASAASSEGGER